MSTATARARRFHPAWIVAAVAFLALVGAAGFRAAPSVLMLPLEEEFGWSRTQLSLAVTVNLLLFGLSAGALRDATGEYTLAWFGAAALCLVAAAVSAGITRKTMQSTA
jgi:hypothetical protein